MGDYWNMSAEGRAKISAAAKRRYEGHRVSLICPQCGSIYSAIRSQLEQGKGKFCSRVCKGLASRGVRPAPGTEFQKGIVPWNKGIPMSLEQREEISKRTKGKTFNTGRTHFPKGHIPWTKGKHVKLNNALDRWREEGNLPSNYKGDDVGYGALHRWISRHKGKPSKCEFCGTTVAKRFEWANVDGKYRRVLEDYVRLCKKCHNDYDGVNAWQNKAQIG